MKAPACRGFFCAMAFLNHRSTFSEHAVMNFEVAMFEFESLP